MKAHPVPDIEKISQFIKGQVVSAPFFVDSPLVIAAYKKYFAVLLLRHGISKIAIPNDARRYLDESASDLSYSLYLSALGFYKPARLSLRGAIENVLRSALAQAGHDLTNVSVSQMFEEVKNHGSFKSANSAVSQLKDCYATLCRTSHTIDIKFMAQRVPFSELREVDQKKFDANLNVFVRVSTGICSLLFVSFPEAIAKLSPDKQDLVRVEVPKAIKKAILDA